MTKLLIVGAVCLVRALVVTAGEPVDEELAAGANPTSRTDSFVSEIRLPDGENHATVPLLRGGESFYVQVNINGRDAGVFLLDTGVTGTVIDRRNAEILRLPVMQRGGLFSKDVPRQEARLLRIDSMAIGPIQVATRRLVDVDLTPSSRNKGMWICGIIGADILSRMPVTLDLAAGTMTFHAPDAFNEPTEDEQFDLVVRGSTPHVRGRIGDRFDALLLIDTGDEHPLHLNPDFVQRHPEALTGPVFHLSGALGYPDTRTVLEEQHGSLNLFGRSFDRVLMSVRSTRLHDSVRDGVVGTPLLGRFRITFDFAGQRMWAGHQPPKTIPQRLAEGLDVNGEDLVGRTPLFAAIQDGDVEAVNALIDAGADVNVMDNRANRPLRRSSAAGTESSLS